MFIKKSILLIGIAWFVQACDSNELEFENQGELAVLEVEPKYATAGDYIQLVGKGFTRDAKVKIGGSQISDFELVSASSIVIKVPTGQAGLSKIQVEQYGLKQSIEYFYLQTPGEAGEETVGTPGWIKILFLLLSGPIILTFVRGTCFMIQVESCRLAQEIALAIYLPIVMRMDNLTVLSQKITEHYRAKSTK